MFDTRTPRKPVRRTATEVVRVHTLEDLLERPKSDKEGKEIPAAIPANRRDPMQDFLPPNPTLVVPRASDVERRESAFSLLDDPKRNPEKDKGWLTPGQLARDTKSGAPGKEDTPAAKPSLDQLSDHILFQDVTTIEDQGNLLKTPERGLDARERQLSEKEKKGNWVRTTGVDIPSGNSNSPPEHGLGYSTAINTGNPAPKDAAISAGSIQRSEVEAYSEAMLTSRAAQSMREDLEEKKRTETSFPRSRELMASISAPYAESDRARREVGTRNALEVLSASYRDVAARAQPGLRDATSTPFGAPSPQGSQHSPGAATPPLGSGGSGLGQFSPGLSSSSPGATPLGTASLGTARLGAFTPASPEVRLGASASSSAPSRTQLGASPASPLPSSFSPPSTPRPPVISSGPSDLLRQRRLEDGRIRSQMGRLPGQPGAGLPYR